MPEVIADLELAVVDLRGRRYFVNVVGEPAGNGWEAWLEFVPTDDSDPLLSPTETTQPTREAIVRWASSLDTVYLEGAFQRAIENSTVPAARLPVTPVLPRTSDGVAAVLDPFEIYKDSGKAALRTRLLPLTRAELVTIIDLHDLDPAGLSLSRLTHLQLVVFIVTAVEIQIQQGRA